MGREKIILLGLLGLLAGVFVGALSIKLLSTRPPTGAGPDIRTEAAVATAQERVEPPAPSPHGWDFSTAPPLVADEPEPVKSDVPVTEPTFTPAEPPRFSRFTNPPPALPENTAATEAVTPASWQRSEPMPEVPAVEPGPPAADPFLAAAEAPAPVVAGDYLVRAGDSWWGVAERAYGDGRLYRALFAWNRARDARITLAPGTRLDVPPLPRLQAAWPALATPAARR
jgi:5'-nucleotidase